MIRNRVVRAVAVGVSCAVALAAGSAAPAEATYRGRVGRIAFGMADTAGRHIYSVRPDGSGLRQLTTGSHTDLCAAYAPGGRHIAFCSDRSGLVEIWTMTAHGHHLRQVTHIANAIFPDYDPSGTVIAFNGQVAGDPNDEIFTVHTDGSHLRQITRGSGNNDWPAWSPDGRRLAFVSDRSGVTQVWTMGRSGHRPTQLTFGGETHDELPDWRPDGKRIAYEQGLEGSGKIWVMRADGSHQHQVSSGTGDDFGPAWSPDGRRIAFARQLSDTDRPVEVMDADGSDLHVLADPAGGAIQFVPAWQARQRHHHGEGH